MMIIVTKDNEVKLAQRGRQTLFSATAGMQGACLRVRRHVHVPMLSCTSRISVAVMTRTASVESSLVPTGWLLPHASPGDRHVKV